MGKRGESSMLRMVLYQPGNHLSAKSLEKHELKHGRRQMPTPHTQLLGTTTESATKTQSTGLDCNSRQIGTRFNFQARIIWHKQLIRN